MSAAPPTDAASLAAAARSPTAARNTYDETLRSTTLIGGVTVVGILLGAVRNKLTALWVGDVGFGLLGNYASITNVVGVLAGMGVTSSGVRQIAQAAGTGDAAQLARTVKTLRRTALILGVLGTLLMLTLARPLSLWMFDSAAHTTAFCLLSLTVLFTSVSGAQTALIQGTRRIKDLARLSLLGAVIGTAASVPMIWAWRLDGVVPFLLTVSAATILTSWWFARRIKTLPGAVSWSETWTEAQSLLKLGLVMMSSGLMVQGVNCLTRAIVTHQLGLGPSGQYHAAWVLSGLYVGSVLSAMGADYFPRLAAVAEDNGRVNRYVNEQLEIGLILSVPGILATVVFAPWVMKLFYSGEFGPAVDVLRWQILGVLLRVAAWPLGYVLIARAESWLFFWTEVGFNSLHLALVWFGIRYAGLPGTGLAFFLAYLIYFLAMIWILRHKIGFRFSAVNGRLMGLITPAILALFVASSFLTPVGKVVVGGVTTIAVGLVCLHTLATLMPEKRILATYRRYEQRVLKLWRR